MQVNGDLGMDTRWQRRLNHLIRQAMVHNILGFGPSKIVLTEYPRSGGTWVGQMMAEYLDLPYPLNSFPPRRRCILRGHYLYVSNANDTIVIWRDGRDTVVSQYYYHLFHRRTTIPGHAEKQQERLGIRDTQDIQFNLPRYIEYCFTDGPPHHMTWTSFVEAWKNRTGYVETSYEAMRENPGRELNKILKHLSVFNIDDMKLDSCIKKFSFENATGRRPGEEDAYSFARKAIIGDWKNYFTREAREIFDHYAGQALIELGYESDHSWVNGCSDPCLQDSADVSLLVGQQT